MSHLSQYIILYDYKWRILRTPTIDTIDLWQSQGFVAQERRLAAKGTGREKKKPRLMAVSDGEGSE